VIVGFIYNLLQPWRSLEETLKKINGLSFWHANCIRHSKKNIFPQFHNFLNCAGIFAEFHPIAALT